MLSVAKLTPGQESYYERSVAAGLDDYYAGRGESPGVWTGRGAAAFGLAGVVREGQLGLLIRGLHPETEEELRRHPKARTITVERIHPVSGERRTERKKLAPVAGYDLVFSPPKSVSLLHALGDEETRRAVNEAHTSAWQAALTYLEDEACVTRRGRNGVRREHAPGFVAAAYQHRTSRAQDPHLHTHVIVANMANSPSDGKWRALDGEPILKSYRLAAGYLYQAHLRAELGRALGVEWRRPVKGMAELEGVPREAVAEFSRRRAQVVEHLRDHVGSGFYSAQLAAVETRERKEHVDLDRLREDWRARAAEHGLGQREFDAAMNRGSRRDVSSDQLLAIARRMIGATGLTERRTAFSAPELVMAWAAAHIQGGTAQRIRRVCERFVGFDGVEQVGDEETPGRPAHYSTAELIDVERSALALVERGLDAGAPVASVEIVDGVHSDAGERTALSSDQMRMVHAVAGRRDRVVCVVGLAGAGKTMATATVARAFAMAGVPVVGAAPSGVAAEKLQDETGVPSTTLHRLLRHGVPDRSLLIVDEAGMAETRILARVLEHVERAQAKALLIGDPKQLPAVGAGGLFAGIVERHGAVELTENRRQRDAAERAALEAVRNGLGRDYLAFAEGRGTLISSETPDATRTRLLADWWSSAREDLAGNVMIALRRRDVAELNALARGLMDTHGRLGRERVTVAGREFAAGDRIVCLRNSDVIGVKNGTRGTVEAVDVRRGALMVATDRGDRVELKRRYLESGEVRHAYALTGHAAQGVTVERAFVLGSGGARLQEWGYVALSRARDSTRLYVTGDIPERESHFHELDDRTPVTQFAAALEESAIERLAVDQRPLPVGPRHEARAEIERPRLEDRGDDHIRSIQRQRLALARMSPELDAHLLELQHPLGEAGLTRRDDLGLEL